MAVIIRSLNDSEAKKLGMKAGWYIFEDGERIAGPFDRRDLAEDWCERNNKKIEPRKTPPQDRSPGRGGMSL